MSVLMRVLTSSDGGDLCLVADWPGAVLPLLVTGHTCSTLSSGPTLCLVIIVGLTVTLPSEYSRAETTGMSTMSVTMLHSERCIIKR